MEAIAEAKKGDFAAAKEKIRAADEELIKAHHFQTALIQNNLPFWLRLSLPCKSSCRFLREG